MNFAQIDDSHDPALQSWVESANDDGCEFPLQNLPFGRFRERDDEAWRIGVAIGDQVLDLRRTGLVDHADMNRLMCSAAPDRRALRQSLSRSLTQGSAQQAAWRKALRPLDRVQLGLPCVIGNYTDFYVGIHHATAVGRLFRPDNPLLLERARHPSLGEPAARAVPGEELREHGLAVDRHAGGAGAVPAAVRARRVRLGPPRSIDRETPGKRPARTVRADRTMELPMDDPRLYLVRVWRERGFRASARAADECEPHWFSSPVELGDFLAAPGRTDALPVSDRPEAAPGSEGEGSA